mgnify:CR=1 FL=1
MERAEDVEGEVVRGVVVGDAGDGGDGKESETGKKRVREVGGKVCYFQEWK